MNTSKFSDREFQSATYRWRADNGKILVTIMSQPFRLDHMHEEKITNDKDGSKVDIDALELIKFFEEEAAKFPVKVEYKFRHNINFSNYMTECIDVMHSKDKMAEYEKYDCFVFVFLTYIGEKSPDDQQLHFHDRYIPLEDILNNVKSQEVTRGKPKVFLIQSDDNSLLGGKTRPKGHVVVKEKKIPQDADRLIIQSTIPQGIANKKTPTDTKNPSFLIQAFMDSLKENWKLEEHQRQDFLSLSTVINGKVDTMIRESGDKRANDMQVPLVTSTLTKQLIF